MKSKSQFISLYSHVNQTDLAKQLVIEWLHDQLESKSPQAVSQHPLGFYLLEPHKSGNVTVRLHYWPAKATYFPQCEEDMHDHVWSLDSYILSGALTNVETDIEENANGPWQVSVINKVDNHETIHINPTRYKTTNETRTHQKPGSRYQISPGVFHKTEVLPRKAVVTLVRSGPLLARPSRGLVPAGTQQYATKKGTCSPTASKRIMNEIIKLLTSSNGKITQWPNKAPAYSFTANAMILSK